VVFDGIIDGGCGKKSIEPSSGGGRVVFGQNGFDYGFFGDSFSGLG